MTTAAVIVAAGRGTRAGGDTPKQYAELAGKAVLAHTVAAFVSHPRIDIVQVVIHADDTEAYDRACGAIAASADELRTPVPGGATRQESVFRGLEAVRDAAPEYVLIHDAARPFVTPDVIDRVIEALGEHDGAVPGLPVADTLKRAVDMRIAETVDRSALWAVQTPQGFRYEAVRKAHQAVDGVRHDLTDDAAVAEHAGLDVALVDGDARNRKLTTAQDVAQARMEMMTTNAPALPDVRVGNGYDVHAFEPGDSVILCGVEIPHDAKLKGHSDADVGMHAATDAIYGALGEGDIGQHFPPSDPQWKGAASHIFLEAAGARVRERGGVIGHVDVTLICEAPKIGPHAQAMRAALAAILGIDKGRISVKATTSEQLGFTGRREGIAASATATVRLPLEDGNGDG